MQQWLVRVGLIYVLWVQVTTELTYSNVPFLVERLTMHSRIHWEYVSDHTSVVSPTNPTENRKACEVARQEVALHKKVSPRLYRCFPVPMNPNTFVVHEEKTEQAQ